MQTKYFHSGEAVTVTIIVNGTNVVSSFVKLLRISLGKLSCRLTARHGLQILAEINVALHQAVETSVVDPAGFHANDTWLENTFAQRRRSGRH